MSVKLEKYLSRQRKNLDVETPDDSAIWEGIRSDLHYHTAPEKHNTARLRLIRIRNIAAAAILLFSLGYIANDIINGKRKASAVTLSSINTELGRRENEYKTLVRYKTGEIGSLAGSGDKEIKELFSELRELDTIYNKAIADLAELGPNEKVINTIFNTYEQKIRLLEMIILESNKIQRHENNEKINL